MHCILYFTYFACKHCSLVVFCSSSLFLTSIINNSVIPLIFALAVVFFVWGAINVLIINADDEKKREQGKQFMIWGIVALAVMLSIWGLVTILGNTFNIDTSVIPQVTPP